MQPHPNDMQGSLFHKEKWCLDIAITMKMNTNGLCTVKYLQWLLSHLVYEGHSIQNDKGLSQE